MRDWRLDKLYEILAIDRRMAPSQAQRAYVVSGDLVGHRVIRPGVPDHDARESWHLTRRGARSTAARWNATLALGDQDQNREPSDG